MKMTGGKILCVDQYSTIGGGQKSLLDLVPAFEESGWGVVAAIPDGGPFCTTLRARGTVVHMLPEQRYASLRKPVRQLIRYAASFPRLAGAIQSIVDADKIDMLYVNGPRMLPPAAWVACKVRIPLVFHCHNRLFQDSAVILAGEALRMANAWTIGSCEYAVAPFKDYLWPSRLRVLYNGIEQITVRRGRRPRESWRIGVVGRVEQEKGQLEFVQAARIVRQKFPEAQFRVIGSPMFSGDGYYKKVRTAAANSPVEFTDWQSDLSRIYSDLDLLVVPSTAQEATTRVIPEAFSAGIPVLATACGGIPEILEDEATGFLAAGSRSDVLAGRILDVLRMDGALIERVIARARDEWARRFSLPTYRRGVLDVLQAAQG